MAAKIHPYSNGNIVTSSYDDLSSNGDVIRQYDTSSSSLKPKITQWPALLWIALGILIFISLVIVIVVPIVASVSSSSSSATVSTICPTTAITTTVTSGSLPSQCSSYTLINDNTRSPDYTGTIACDNDTFTSTPEWVRFTGSGGTLLASCPINTTLCGTDAPGWYSGVLPSTAGTVTSGFVCFNYFNNDCYWTNFILVTNCNGFYVYYLSEPPVCDLRYCTI